MKIKGKFRKPFFNISDKKARTNQRSILLLSDDFTEKKDVTPKEVDISQMTKYNTSNMSSSTRASSASNIYYNASNMSSFTNKESDKKAKREQDKQQESTNGVSRRGQITL